MIKDYRIKRGYTQEELAEILNISPRQLQRIENGESIPKIETLQKMALTLKIDDKDIGKYVKEVERKKDNL